MRTVRTTFKMVILRVKMVCRSDISNSERMRVKLSWIDDMMTRDDVVMTKKSTFFKIVQKRLNMIFKGILRHLAKFQISWASFTVI